jgi:Sec-independent protein translocase protein TatA
MNFKNKEDLKNHVERLKAFYNEFYSFLIVSAFGMLIWLLAGAGYFWPIWVLVLWGGPLFFKASKLRIISEDYYKMICTFRDQLPFLKKSWEHDKMQELQKAMMGDQKETATPKVKKTVASTKATKTLTPKKKVAKKAPSKKSPAKTAAVKKTPVTKGTTKKAAPKKKAPKKK